MGDGSGPPTTATALAPLKKKARKLRDLALPVRTGQVTHEAAARLPRQAADQTRQDLTDAAILLVNAFVEREGMESYPPADPFPFLRLDDVLAGASEIARGRLMDEGGFRPDERVAPLSPGAFYKAWDDGEEHESGRGAVLASFHRAVAATMLEHESLIDLGVYKRLVGELYEAGEPFSTAVKAGIELEFTRWRLSPALAINGSLAVYYKDAEVAAVTNRLERAQLDRFVELYEFALKLYRRRMRAGLSVTDMATMVADLIGGAALFARFLPETRNKFVDVTTNDTEPAQTWHLVAFAANAIYESSTEDDPSAAE